MNKKQRAQLQELAIGLITLKLPERAKFDMETWGCRPLDRSSKTLGCGYAACAVGWGPKLVKGWALPLVRDKINFSDAHVVRPRFGKLSDYEAVGEYFGITEREALFLFAPTSYHNLYSVPPEEVGCRLLRFLAGIEKPEDKSGMLCL